LIHFLQFVGLFLERHDQTTVSASQESLNSLREGNCRRAKGWREDAGPELFPKHVVAAFAVTTERLHTTAEQEHNLDQDGDVDMEDSLRNRNKTLPQIQTNGTNTHSSDEHDSTQPETITLLDILPAFIHLSATRMAMGSMINEPETIPDTYEDSSDDVASTDTLSWATEPQWLRLAASFMLQAILEQYLDLDFPRPSDASYVLEVFAWGYIETTPNATNKSSHPKTTTQLGVDKTKSLAIPDSDEGDITALGTTPDSSPTTLPPSHSDIFILRTEKAPGEAGKAWRALRLQAMSLLVPSDENTSLQEQLAKVRLHHPLRTFEKDLLGFLTGLFYSVEEPLLVQLERVWPAWAAARDGAGAGNDEDVMCGEDNLDRSGWLEEAGEKVTVGGNELSEGEVEALMALLGEWWDC